MDLFDSILVIFLVLNAVVHFWNNCDNSVKILSDKWITSTILGALSLFGVITLFLITF